MTFSSMSSMWMATHTSPDAAILIFTVGLFLIYVELNRPGFIIPGCLGLLAVLFSIASLVRFAISPTAILLVVSAVVMFLLDLVPFEAFILPFAATLALTLGLSRLVSGPEPFRVHPITTIPCGLLIGSGTSFLTRIARRARANKAVN